MKRIPGLCSLLIFFVSLTQAQQIQPQSPQQILDQMFAAYAACTSYADEGQVRVVFERRELEQQNKALPTYRRTVEIKPFATAFVRPSNFRYELWSLRAEVRARDQQQGLRDEDRLANYMNAGGKGLWDSYIVWMSGDSVKTWWSIKPQVKDFNELGLAIAGPTGISSGSAYYVPMLLMPPLRAGHRLKSLGELKLREETLQGRAVFRIQGSDAQKKPITIWIDKETSLLLKINEKKKFSDFEAETTITYSPQINLPLPLEKLAFNLPTKNK